MQKFTFIFVLIVVSFFVVTQLSTLTSLVYSNIGFTLLNKGLANKTLQEQEKAQNLFAHATNYSESNQSSIRGAAIFLFHQNAINLSATKWNEIGSIGDDMWAVGIDAYQSGRPDEALRWLQLAKEINPIHQEDAWQTIGKVCQRIKEPESVCDEAVQRNLGNLLVNSNFLYNDDGWVMRTEDASQTPILLCPEMEHQLCAHMAQTSKALPQSSSWWQCVVNLTPGQMYKFSAWIKVEADIESQWRPVYFQGKVNGEPKGFWPGAQFGSSEWHYWEQQFMMPPFDEGFACFHPIRLLGNGEAWFHSPVLSQVNS